MKRNQGCAIYVSEAQFENIKEEAGSRGMKIKSMTDFQLFVYRQLELTEKQFLAYFTAWTKSQAKKKVDNG
jgi:hypothetical protein